MPRPMSVFHTTVLAPLKGKLILAIASGSVIRALRWPLFFAAIISVLLATSALNFDDSLASRGLVMVAQGGLRVVVDTGGPTVARNREAASRMRKVFGLSHRLFVDPAYIGRYYYKIEADGALGNDWIATHPFTVSLPGRAARSAGGRRAVIIPLQLIGKASPDAFLACSVAGRRLTMLFDSGAIAWPITNRDLVGSAASANFVSLSTFQRWRHEHPDWEVRASAFEMVRDDGLRQPAPAIRVPSISIGSFSAGPLWFVERRDSTTYDFIRKQDKIVAVGDLGVGTFAGTNLTVDYPRHRLELTTLDSRS